MNKKRTILIVFIWLAVTGLFFQSFTKIKEKERMSNFSKNRSVVIEKGKFQNIEPTKVMQRMSGNTLKKFIQKGEKVPENLLPMVVFDNNKYLEKDKNKLSVTWFGHSSALIELDGKLILTDPALSVNAGPTSFTGTKRFHKIVPVTPIELPQLDVVLISHDHFDHLDKNTIKELDKKTSRYIVPLGVAYYLIKWGVDKEKIEELAWWEDIKIGDTKFVSTPARHFSGRGLFDRNSTLWCSWVIRSEKHAVFFSGDSGYQKAFKEIGEKYGPFDLSLLECGQYNDDWGLIHMSPEESVQASIDINSKLALPIHWGAFSLSVHAWYEPVERFTVKANELGLKIVTPKIGERIEITETLGSEEWWKSAVARE